LTEPNTPDFLTEFQNIREELRAIEAGANQRHAQITAKIAENAVRGTTPNPSRASNPSQTAREAVRGTVEGKGATTPPSTTSNPSQTDKIENYDEFPQIENPGEGDRIEAKDKLEKSQGEKQGDRKATLGDRLRDWRDRTRQENAIKQDKLRQEIAVEKKQFAQKHPNLDRFQRGAGKVVQSLGRANPTRAAARELLEFGIRHLDEKDLKAAKELAGRYGKDIREWIQETRQNAQKQASRWVRREEEKPFFEREDTKAQKIHTEINKLTNRVQREQDKPKEFLDYVGITDEIKYGQKIDHTQIAKWNSKIEGYQQKQAGLQQSLDYSISKKAHEQNFSANFQQYVESKVIPDAREHVGNHLVGTAQERYHHYLHNAVHHLGEKHFDLVFHPKNGEHFDRFAATRMFQDGFDPKAIEEVLHQSPFRHEHMGTSYTAKFNPLTQENQAIRDRVAVFQVNKAEKILEAKVNPHDAEFQKTLGDKLANWRTKREGEVLKEAQQTLKEYSAVRGQIPDGKDTTAVYQYRLELGRWHSQGHDLGKSHDLIGTQLTKAGYTHKEIEEAFRAYNPSVHESRKQAGELYKNQVFSRISEPKHLEDWQRVDDFKAQHGTEIERRLDRLDLHNAYRHLDDRIPTPSPTQPNLSSRTQENIERDR
jgi:hypothetical protein